jgi:hypothetical protein
MTGKTWLPACCLLAASCASTPRSPDSLPGGSDVLSPRLAGMEPGFDEPEGKASWRPGDAVVYGVTLRSPRESREWLLKIEVHSHPGAAELADEPLIEQIPTRRTPLDSAVPEPAPVLLRVEIFDAKGVSEHVRHVLVPAADLEHGLYPGCRAGRSRPRAGITQDGKGFLRGYTAEEVRSLETLSVFLRLGSPALRPILDAVVARPSIAQVLRHGGVVHLAIGGDFSASKESGRELALGVDPVDSFPFEIMTYGVHPALAGNLFVTESRPPFLPGAGIVGIDAWHPDDEAARVSVRLLSARRGRLDRDPGPGGG